MLNRKNTAIVGAQRHGKSYYTEKQAIAYAKSGGTSIAYNVGKPSDFSRFIEVKFIDPDTAKMQAFKSGNKGKKIPNEIQFFAVSDTGKIYHVRDFKRMFSGKCVKVERITSSLGERLFFLFVYEYLYDTLLILDDCRAMFRNGLSPQFLQVAGRVNHCGKKYAPTPDACGVDLIMIFHGFETMNKELLFYINSVVVFWTRNEPNLNGESPDLGRVINTAYTELLRLPKYSRIEIDALELTSKVFVHKTI